MKLVILGYAVSIEEMVLRLVKKSAMIIIQAMGMDEVALVI